MGEHLQKASRGFLLTPASREVTGGDARPAAGVHGSGRKKLIEEYAGLEKA
jgi:hypothetical protein